MTYKKLAAKVRRTAVQMRETAEAMQEAARGDINCLLAKHGVELEAAAAIATSWAREIERIQK